jgi:DNA-binding MarR family transcriptional regulator
MTSPATEVAAALNTAVVEPALAPEPEDELIEALQATMRVLAGLALRSIDSPGGAVSLPQFRVLAILADLGSTRSGRVARALGLDASTVTRLADRLVASGHVERQGEPGHRGVVTLALTAQGRSLVSQAARWRRGELSRIVDRLAPEDRVAATRVLRHVVDAAGPGYGTVVVGLMPL